MRKILIIIAASGIVIGVVNGLLGSASQAEEATLYKNPGCQCCDGYADYLRQNGFTVIVKPTDDLPAMSRKAGIPDDLQGCHLALIDGYMVSGHVPVATVKKLLSERPSIKGITLPGMPLGSPGMSGDKTEPFVVYTIGDGSPKVFSRN